MPFHKPYRPSGHTNSYASSPRPWKPAKPSNYASSPKPWKPAINAARHATPENLRQVETSNQVRGFNASKKSVARLFGLLDTYPVRTIPPGDLSIAFLDDAAICRLHEQFLGDATPTDVITFPGDSSGSAGQPPFSGEGTPSAETGMAQASEPLSSTPRADLEPFAGEICVSVSQARREAAKHGNTVQDELLLYLAHGWLHLSGLDDHSDEDVLLMRAAERDVLDWLRGVGFKPGWGA